MTMLLNPYRFGAIYDTDVQAWYDAHSTAPSPTWAGHVNTFVLGLKAGGTWTKKDRIGIFRGETEQGSLVDLKQPSKPWVTVGAPTHEAGLGFALNTLNTQYISSGELPTASPNTYALNSAAMGVGCYADGDSGARYHLGLVTGGRFYIAARDVGGDELVLLNGTATSILQANTGTVVGRRAASRTASNIIAGFAQGVKTLAGTAVSTTVPSGGNVTVGHNGGVFGGDSFNFAWYGAGHSDAEITADDALWATLMAA